MSAPFSISDVIDLRVAGGGRDHQRRRAVRRHRLRIRAGGEQRRDDVGVAALGGEIQRRVGADARRRAHVGAGVDQHLRHLGVALDRRPVQRGRAVALRLVDVEALLQQRVARLRDRRSCAAVGDRRACRAEATPLSSATADRRRQSEACKQSIAIAMVCAFCAICGLLRRRDGGFLHRVQIHARPCCRRTTPCRRRRCPAAPPASRWPSACRRRP